MDSKLLQDGQAKMAELKAVIAGRIDELEKK